jgi:hypothetical protein
MPELALIDSVAIDPKQTISMRQDFYFVAAAI